MNAQRSPSLSNLHLLTDFVQRVRTNVEQVIVGKTAAIDLLLIALLCGGHVLIEDVPGVGKTMLARTLALSLGLRFQRVQCTPDLLPNDLTGVSVYRPQNGQFVFQPGPLFSHIVLVDEINRATPRTQSALLEAMGEAQVSIDGVTHRLPEPFLVIATQNPIEFEGTFPLPEAQLDRFLLQIRLGYPSPEEELHMLTLLAGEHPIFKVTAAVDGSRLPDLQRMIYAVRVAPSLREYLVRLAHALRHHPDLALAMSPRATLALFRAGQARAVLAGRDYVLPDDYKALAVPVLQHRLLVRPAATLRGRTSADILAEVLESVELPLE
ncbi:MoxR family ATPase [Chloroflexus sp. MS-CIW-1]|uniref:AAA family ATPase n=1 Tax=unclassified Chloroflexus TaxID=2633855 RepID=UPI00054E443F|nr:MULTISPECIES: MoxR family ATPase [unclassified Chloroflexus]MDN5271434.1 MoxR family ATPase [Chloroflexus sp. MS-CIW-1]